MWWTNLNYRQKGTRIGLAFSLIYFLYILIGIIDELRMDFGWNRIFCDEIFSMCFLEVTGISMYFLLVIAFSIVGLVLDLNLKYSRRYFEKYGKEFKGWQQGLRVGFMLSVAYLFGAPIVFALDTGILGCYNGFLSCYYGSFLFNMIFGLPIILGIMVCSIVVGYVLERLKKVQ